MSSKDGYCFIWHEGLSGSGVNEIGTCVQKYLKVQKSKGINKVILYSDNCSGQNRNRYFVTMIYIYHAKKTLQFTSLQHKFLERGHTHNENDSIHAAIERNSKGRSIYTTPQWAATLRTSRHTPRPYIVNELSSSDFLDFKKLSSEIQNLDFDDNGQKFEMDSY